MTRRKDLASLAPTNDVARSITVQGKPVARRGRKARDLAARPPGCRPDRNQATDEVASVKAILARFTVALTLLASMALTLGAGVKWV